MAAAHASIEKAAPLADIKLPKAVGPNAQTVAEVVTRRDQLKDKTVLVRGTVEMAAADPTPVLEHFGVAHLGGRAVWRGGEAGGDIVGGGGG